MAYGPTSLRSLRCASLALMSTLIVACSGGGGDSGGGGGGGSPATVTISGRITFDRVPFKVTPGTGLNFAGVIESPARQVVVEAVQPGNVLGGEVLVTSTVTDAAGDYSLQVPANTTILIRAKAQMLKTGTAPTWNFRVLNNAANDALYVLDGASASSGNANSVRNLRATTGFGTVNYTGPRSAAPFAILDTMYQVKALILSARTDTAFPALDLFWSANNRAASPFCPDNGDIVSSLYTVFGAGGVDDCSTPTPGRDGIYILGSFPTDSDEFDQHVIAHEAGHYFEDRFSRSDSIGGEHSLQDRLDLRVAFGEGWGDAFGAMVLNDPVYRDSFSGTTQDSSFNLETGVATTPGWSSEFSTLKVLWDLFDPANEPGVDDVALGFTPIYNVMTGSQPGTDALTGIFPFARALKAGNPAASTGINTLLASQGIATTSDDFASGEVTYAGPNVVPLYTAIQSGTPVTSLCGSAVYGEYNKASNRRFLAFQSGSARSITITATVTSGAADADPDIIVWRRGGVVAVGEEVASQEVLPVAVQAGTYVIEVYDFNHVDSDGATGNSATCMTVSIAG